jgi:putative tryptophan/tyrosine transport system substrate-binding protein
MAINIRRREFIVTFGSAAAWPLVARAQQPALPIIGVLSNASRQLDADRLTALWRGLKEAGYVEGVNVASEYRWAEDRYDRLPALAADLGRLRPAVIVAVGGPISSLAAQAASTTVPIVFVVAGDPVKLGLVASINRPGGNVTGVASLASAVVAKQIEALHETVPQAALIGCLLNPNNPQTESATREAQEGTRTLGLQLEVLHARDEVEIEAAFATLVQKRAGGLVVVSDGFFNSRPAQFAALAARHALPAVYSQREFASAGGLMSYGTANADAYRQAGAYAGRILKGQQPADLPVFQLAKVELVINAKAAEALGITLPLTLLGRADDVIE